MRKKYRNIEFDVHPLDDKTWEWMVYPKIGEGMRFGGRLEGNEERVTGECHAAIDGWPEGKH